MQLVSVKKYTKIFGLVLLVVIILAATIVMGKGATNMFSRASSCNAQNVSAVQVSANSAVIAWESSEVTQGLVQYGTNSTSLNFSAPEGSPNKSHNLPLTLLTPNTVYYYLISVGKTKCDSSGQSCTDATCVPWSFTTAAITPQAQIVAPILTPTLAPTLVPATPSATLAATPSPVVTASSTSSAQQLSVFCQQVKANIGGDSTDATKWALLKQYDIDGNGRIMSMDVLKCQSSGK